MVADMVTLWGHPLQSWMTQLLLSLFSLLAASVFTAQISMSVKSPWMCVMAASAPTPRGRTSACVMTVSCHRRIWRPVWVTMHAQSAITEQVCSYSHVALLCVRFSFSVQRPWEDENKAVSSVCFFLNRKHFCVAELRMVLVELTNKECLIFRLLDPLNKRRKKHQLVSHAADLCVPALILHSIIAIFVIAVQTTN